MFSFSAQYDPRQEFARFSDFDELPNWLEALNDGASGTNTLNDTRGGTYSLVTAGADNDYHYLASKAEVWRVVAGKPIQFGASIRLTEAATSAANIFVGLTDTVAAGALVDNGGGPPSSYDGIGFFKVDGGTVWQCEVSNGSTQSTTTSAATFTSGTAYELAFVVKTASSSDTVAQVDFYINSALVATHPLTISGMDEMHMLIGVKAGSTSAETLIVDWAGCRQAR